MPLLGVSLWLWVGFFFLIFLGKHPIGAPLMDTALSSHWVEGDGPFLVAPHR